MKPTRLILIRHGSTDWGRQRRYCGSSDVSLNKKGRKEALKLRKRFEDEDICKVYSSDRKRAYETAALIFRGRPILKKTGLREIDFGCFEGLTYGQIMKRYTVVYKKWLKDAFNVTIPGGEKTHAFRTRVLRTLRKIVSAHPHKTVAVVSHGGAIGMFIAHLLKKRSFWEYVPSSCGVSIVEYKKGKPDPRLFNNKVFLSKECS